MAEMKESKEKLDYQKRLEALQSLAKDFKEPDTLIDCICFHDGKTWRAAIDSTGTGDFTNAPLMASFEEEQQFSRFSIDSLMNYSFNIYDNGTTLSIVTTAGSHGTHVAAITAAFHEPDSELNGVAPGAQLVSLKIGDTRLGSMETGRGLLRALNELVRLKVDVANISYGEAVLAHDQGRFYEQVRKVVNNSGCIIVSSGGNAGPALSTVGAPGGIMDCTIGVGAWVSKSQMEAEYNLLKTVPERAYTWCSRGPTPDGDYGVDIHAPGSAITSVPKYTLNLTERMNGTSMSSPNAAGCVALLLSGLKETKVKYSPYKIKAALRNTGLAITQDDLDIKLVQVEKAFEFMTREENRDHLASLISYKILIDKKDRGVYLRSQIDTTTLQERKVSITLEFPNNDDPNVNPSKSDFELLGRLESTKPWITTPEFVHLAFEGQQFDIRIDPTGLEPGMHFGCINLYDSKNPVAGVLTSIPVTVCKPLTTSTEIKLVDQTFNSGEVKRYFVDVPGQANICKMVISSKPGRKTAGNVRAHLIQLLPQSRYTRYEHEYAFKMEQTGQTQLEHSRTFGVVGGVVMEVCLAQFWSSLDETNIDVSFEFNSILASTASTVQPLYGIGSSPGGELLVNADMAGMTRIDISTPLSSQKLTPKLTFTTLNTSYRSTEQTLTSLLSRDIQPDSRQVHELILKYSIKIPADITTTTIKIPRFNDQVYDSHLDNFALMVFDKNKSLINFQDCYPKPLKLEEGEYQVHVQCCSVLVGLLEEIKDLMILVEMNLKNPISVPVYGNLGTFGSKALKEVVMGRGGRETIWIGKIGFPKSAIPGDILSGSLELIKTDDDLFKVYCPMTEKEFKGEEDFGTKLTPRPDSVIMGEEIRDLEIKWLKKLTKDTIPTQVDFLKSIGEKYQDDLVFVKARLEIFKKFGEEVVDKSLNTLPSLDTINLGREYILDLLPTLPVDKGKVIILIKVSIYFGKSRDPLKKLDEESKELEKRMTLYRQILALSYSSLCEIYNLYLDILTGKVKVEDGSAVRGTLDTFQSEFEKALVGLIEWTLDHETNCDYIYYTCISQIRLGYDGHALSLLNKYLVTKPDERLWKLRKKILVKLGWDFWVEREEKMESIKFPKTFCKF